MNFGETSGRGFESAATPYLFGAPAILAVLLWLWLVYMFRGGDGPSVADGDTNPGPYPDPTQPTADREDPGSGAL